jgi:nicotinamidase-related amidase
MPLVFPIASDARSALAAEATARTLAEAALRAAQPVVLVSEWLRPTPSEQAGLQSALDRATASGFVQLYEDDRGRPVIAVTFWKPKGAAEGASAEAPRETPASATSPRQKRARRTGPASAAGKRHRVADHRQLDLFQGPDQAGHESPDPHNPRVVLVEEEGVGAAFGLANDPSTTPPAPSGKRGRRR